VTKNGGILETKKPKVEGQEEHTYLEISEKSAKVPPSPSSSAFKTINMYLIVTIIVRAQIMSDSEPTKSS
jgi:hypothetical protein